MCSDAGLVFLYFFMFFMASMAFCFFISGERGHSGEKAQNKNLNYSAGRPSVMCIG